MVLLLRCSSSCFWADWYDFASAAGIVASAGMIMEGKAGRTGVKVRLESVI